jgi:hypothetical protein
MKDEALKLASALDHWATQMDMGRKPDPKSLIRKASAELRRLQAELDAVKQALAAPVQEPVAFKQFLSDVHTAAGLVTHGKQCKALGERLSEGVMRYIATPPAGQPAPVQESVAWRNAAIRVGEDLCSVGPFGYYDMTAEQWLDWALSVVTVHAPPAAQPAVPDAIHHTDLSEHPQYIEGWNDCRAEMLKGMKP